MRDTATPAEGSGAPGCRPLSGDGGQTPGAMRVEVAERARGLHRGRRRCGTPPRSATSSPGWLAESEATDDPLPGRLGRFLDAVRLRQQVGDVPAPKRAEIEAIVYPPGVEGDRGDPGRACPTASCAPGSRS